MDGALARSTTTIEDATTDENKNKIIFSCIAQTVELTARTALAGNFRKATAPRAAAKVRGVTRLR